MTDAIGPEEDAFLNAAGEEKYNKDVPRPNSRTFLIGLRADGSPTGWPMLGNYEDGGLEFSTYARAQKVRDFERNANACCAVAPVGWDRALVVGGTIEIRAPQEGSKRAMLRFEPADARFVPGFGVTEGPWD